MKTFKQPELHALVNMHGTEKLTCSWFYLYFNHFLSLPWIADLEMKHLLALFGRRINKSKFKIICDRPMLLSARITYEIWWKFYIYIRGFQQMGLSPNAGWMLSDPVSSLWW